MINGKNDRIRESEPDARFGSRITEIRHSPCIWSDRSAPFDRVTHARILQSVLLSDEIFEAAERTQCGELLRLEASQAAKSWTATSHCSGTLALPQDTLYRPPNRRPYHKEHSIETEVRNRIHGRYLVIFQLEAKLKSGQVVLSNRIRRSRYRHSAPVTTCFGFARLRAAASPAVQSKTAGPSIIDKKSSLTLGRVDVVLDLVNWPSDDESERAVVEETDVVEKRNGPRPHPWKRSLGLGLRN